MKISCKESVSERLPLDAVVYDFINYLIYDNPDMGNIHLNGSLPSKYKKALAVVLYDNTIGATMTDIAQYTNATNRSILDKYLVEHEYRMYPYEGRDTDTAAELLEKRKLFDEKYQNIYLDMLSSLEKYRQIKNEIYLSGDCGTSYAKYGDEPLATCSRTGKPIRLGDFVASSTQGNSQFLGLPLIEIESDVIGVHNHNVKVPLKPAAGYTDIINWEKIYLTKQSPLAWRVIL